MEGNCYGKNCDRHFPKMGCQRGLVPVKREESSKKQHLAPGTKLGTYALSMRKICLSVKATLVIFKNIHPNLTSKGFD